jgi:hypothetical protein
VNAQGQVVVPPTANFNASAQSPFFANTAVQQELGLNPTQVDQLNRAYQTALNRYNQGLAGLDAALTPEQRAQRIQQLQTAFNTDFSGNLGTTFTDPAMQQRFNQLNLQSQGLGAFLSSSVQQQLNLTAEQRRQMAELARDWRQQFTDLRRNDRAEPVMTQQQVNDLQTRFTQQVNSILTPQQQQAWSRLIGQRFNFPPGIFVLQPSAGTQGTIGQQSTINPGVQRVGPNSVPQTGATQTPQTQRTVR